MPYQETYEHIKFIYKSRCSPNLEKYMYYENDDEIPDECNCYLHSYDINIKQGDSLDDLEPFIKYIDELVENTENKKQFTFQEIKKIAGIFYDEKTGLKFDISKKI